MFRAEIDATHFMIGVGVGLIGAHALSRLLQWLGVDAGAGTGLLVVQTPGRDMDIFTAERAMCLQALVMARDSHERTRVLGEVLARRSALDDAPIAAARARALACIVGTRVEHGAARFLRPGTGVATLEPIHVCKCMFGGSNAVGVAPERPLTVPAPVSAAAEPSLRTNGASTSVDAALSRSGSVTDGFVHA